LTLPVKPQTYFQSPINFLHNGRAEVSVTPAKSGHVNGPNLVAKHHTVFFEAPFALRHHEMPARRFLQVGDPLLVGRMVRSRFLLEGGRAVLEEFLLPAVEKRWAASRVHHNRPIPAQVLRSVESVPERLIFFFFFLLDIIKNGYTFVTILSSLRRLPTWLGES
jgi:hypothetical protein